MESARQTNPIVAPRWVERRLDAAWLRLIDVRTCLPTACDRDSGVRLAVRENRSPCAEVTPFPRGHIPGSVRLDVTTSLFDAHGALVWAPELARTMAHLGVGDEHTIVIVDDALPDASLVLAAVLQRCGHAATFLLAGGFPRWEREGRPVSRSRTVHPPASFTAKMGR